MKNEDVQDAVPQTPLEPMASKLSDDGVIGWMGNVMAGGGLSVIGAPDISRDLLMLPGSTPTEAMVMIGIGMVMNGVTLHMLQRERRK